VFAILNCSGGRGGVGEAGGEDSEIGGGIGGGGMCGICYLIRLIALLGENIASSSLPSHGDEIRGLVCNSSLLPFLFVLPLRIAQNINVFT